MSRIVIEAIIAYALIPVYVIGLLSLIIIIARSQLGLFTTDKELLNRHKTYSLRDYAVILGTLLLFIALTVFIRRKSL